MFMKKNLSSVFVLVMMGIISADAKAIECTPAPDCAGLGYTKSVADCQDSGMIKCPFDTTKVYCEDAGSAGALIPMVGHILYGDGTFSAGKVKGKIPVGIVFDATNRLAVALIDVRPDGMGGSAPMRFGNEYCSIDTLGECGTPSGGACAISGKENTPKIIDWTECNGTPAATATSLYSPVGCTAGFCKKGQWFLPSIVELKDIYKAKAQVSASITLAGGTQLHEGSSSKDSYWSSSRNSGADYTIISMENSKVFFELYNKQQYVRPVVSFREINPSAPTPTPTPTPTYKVGDTVYKNNNEFGRVIRKVGNDLIIGTFPESTETPSRQGVKDYCKNMSGARWTPIQTREDLKAYNQYFDKEIDSIWGVLVVDMRDPFCNGTICFSSPLSSSSHYYMCVSRFKP